LRRAVTENRMEDRDDNTPVVEVESPTRREVPARFGKYRSLGRIGQGGMADVFLALGRGPAGFNKLVVIKRLRDTVASDETFRDMFLDEARLAARLNHPNVVQTYEVFEHEGAYFITMEYLEGQPLSRIVRECAKRGMRLQPQICARIVSDTLCGLHYAHDAHDFDGVHLQIVHRDVSPQNVFVTYDGQVKVVDFGIAKAERSNTKTQAGFFKGKAAYMAPEQLEGGIIDRRVDVFTTGIVLWELLVGKKLMAAESTAKTLMRLLKEPVPRVSELVPDIDPRLDRIVARALRRDPAQRFQTAGEMRDALEQYIIEGRHIVQHEEIGRIVGDAFRDVRNDLQRRIRLQVAQTSEFPPSGTMPVAVVPSALPALPQGLEAPQPTSMSGINISRTATSVAEQPALTGVLIADRPTAGIRPPSLVVAAIVAVSVAIVFTLVERARTAPPNAPSPAPAPAAIAPVATRPGPLPAPEATETTAPEPPPRVDLTPPAAARPVQAAPVWRGRSQPAEPRQASPAPRSAAQPPAIVAPSAPQTAPPSAPPEPPAARITPPPSPPTPTPSAPATQEGRKFRTTL
jgi:serine/threonine protein kinase